VSSSFLSVAIAKVFGTAMKGRCRTKPELVQSILPLDVTLAVLPCRGGEQFLHELFEPLGYEVDTIPHVLDESFREWSDSIYYTVRLIKDSTLREVLTHLYVLIPVLDNNKHYYIGEAEVENLLAKGENWLARHPKKEVIARRYLKHKVSLARQALARLMDDNLLVDAQGSPARDEFEESLETPLSLNEQRIKAVLSKIIEVNAGSVIDMGCGEGKLLRALIREKSIERMAGMDVSIRSLEIARNRIGLDRLSGRIKEKITLFHGSLMYKDKRFSGFDAAVVMEVVEHLDRPRLAAFERVLFEHARPLTIILTTPNREYNDIWENLSAGALRHSDHRFEWTRAEFCNWAEQVADKFGYSAVFYAIGPEDSSLGSPTQMGVFTRAN